MTCAYLENVLFLFMCDLCVIFFVIHAILYYTHLLVLALLVNFTFLSAVSSTDV